jgi:hypothetical protein
VIDNFIIIIIIIIIIEKNINNNDNLEDLGAEIFKISRIRLNKVLRARRVRRSNFYPEDSQTLVDTLYN